MTDADYSRGLDFRVSADREFCAVSGIGSCRDDVVAIPAAYKNIPVRVVGEKAFSGCARIRSVILPEGIVAVCDGAFEQCTGLESVVLPSTLVSIRASAFSGCASLERAEIPDSVTDIRSYAFSDCAKLTSVALPASLASISGSAFAGCGALKKFELAAECEKFRVSNGCVIDKENRAVVAGLANCLIPNDGSVEIIDCNAFEGCRGLTGIYLPVGVREIRSGAFKDCAELNTVSIPEGVERIGWWAFYGCRSLKEIYLPASLAEFERHISPYDRSDLGVGAFVACTSLAKIGVAEGNQAFETRGGCLFDKDGTLLLAPCTGIPEGLAAAALGDYSMSCADQREVIIPAGVESVGIGAFYGNRSVESVIFPEGVEAIGDWAFADCAGLASVGLPGTLELIGCNAFWRCGALESVTVPGSVRYVGDASFAGCGSLREVGFEPGVENICVSAFADCAALERVTVPESVQGIGAGAFSECGSLREVGFELTDGWNKKIRSPSANAKMLKADNAPALYRNEGDA